MFTDMFTQAERDEFLFECEEKQKRGRLKNLTYTHFDYRVSIERCWKTISNPQIVSQHSFYPLIHFQKKNRRVDNSQEKMHRKEDKEREIYYAAHIDSWIYRYYSYLLNLRYNSKLKEYNGLKYTLRKRKKFDNPSKYKIAMSEVDFRNNRQMIKPGYAKIKRRGIPQGTPLSAVCANIYMLDADKLIYDYVVEIGGLYMRYSDDFIVVLPKNSEVVFSEAYLWIKKCIMNGPDVELQDEKTKIFKCFDGKIVNCTSKYIHDGNDGKNAVDFLGFSFDGTNIRIQSKTIGKFYNNMYRTIKYDIRNGRGTKRAYKKFSERGSAYYRQNNKRNTHTTGDALKIARGNFHDYVFRAESIFKITEDRESIGTDTNKSMQKIRKAVNAAKRL